VRASILGLFLVLVGMVHGMESNYQLINKMQVQSTTGDVYFYLKAGEEWSTGCNKAYVKGSAPYSNKLYSAALAAKMASKKVAFIGECDSNGYFLGNQLFIE
jgi:hypothetical protein